MTSARLFTVVITRRVGTLVSTGAAYVMYDADFAGLHFSRVQRADVVHWVRVAARNRYGKDSQVIFLDADERETS